MGLCDVTADVDVGKGIIGHLERGLHFHMAGWGNGLGRQTGDDVRRRLLSDAVDLGVSVPQFEYGSSWIQDDLQNNHTRWSSPRRA
jgi:hypothetical protein